MANQTRTKTGKRPTVRDIAQAAGVSVATVSRALSRPADVREETRDRVLSVMRETGYQYNQMAAQFRTGSSQCLMVLVSDITNAFYAEFFKGIEHFARSKGYVLLIGDTSDEAESEQAYFDMLFSNKADGLIWNADGIPKGLLEPSAGSNFSPPPLVSCNGAKDFDIPTVRIDNNLGGRLAAEHLIELGHKKVAQVCGPLHHDSFQRRFAGFNAALGDSGCVVPEDATIIGDLEIDYGRKAAEHLVTLSDRPTAVFVHNDQTAIGMLHAFLKLGLSVPGDMSIVGYDDMPYSSAMTPELTTVGLPRKYWGARACEMLIALIEDAEIDEREVAIPPILKVRESSAPPGT